MGTADRRRRDGSAFASCRADGLLARTRKPRVICSGAASRRAALWGFNSVSWGFNSAARSSGRVRGAAAAVRELPGSSGRLSPCLPDDGAQCCGCRRPARPAARSRLTAIVVSAVQALGLVRLPGATPSLFACGTPTPGGPCRVSLDWRHVTVSVMYHSNGCSSPPSDTWGFKSLGTQAPGFGARLEARTPPHTSTSRFPTQHRGQ